MLIISFIKVASTFNTACLEYRQNRADFSVTVCCWYLYENKASLEM